MKKKLIIGLIVVIILIVIAIVLYGIRKEPKKDTQNVELQTTYAVLEFPEMYADDLKHTEILEDGTVVEVFSMVVDSEELELFRIYFGASAKGSIEGYYRTDSSVIPISVLVGNSSQAAMLDEETSTQYFAMVDALNVVLSSLYEDDRFSKDEFGTQSEKVTQTKYWSFKLPESMMCEEIAENGEYIIVFSFCYGDEQYTMYSIYIGDGTKGSPFGTYSINGEVKILSMQVSESVQQEDLPESVANNVYAMMDTISDVMNVITSDKHFAEYEIEN